MQISGIFNIYKPSGMTSHDVVAIVRRITKQRRVGHTGTLDPAAEGVLPICLGRATRVAAFLTADTKEYRAEVIFGRETDTDDATGRPLGEERPVEFTRAQLQVALDEFVGPLAQVPPRYSAVHVNGRRLYQSARRGEMIEAAPRSVEVFRLDLLAWEAPVAWLRVVCGKGTYIRSLARDLGRALGPGAHLGQLVRTRSGPFHLSDSLPLDDLREAFELGYWESQLFPLDEALLDLPALLLGERNSWRASNGLTMPRRSTAVPDTGCRAYGLDGRLLAIVRSEDGEEPAWRPDVVFAPAGGDEEDD